MSIAILYPNAPRTPWQSSEHPPQEDPWLEKVERGRLREAMM